MGATRIVRVFCPHQARELHRLGSYDNAILLKRWLKIFRPGKQLVLTFYYAFALR